MLRIERTNQPTIIKFVADKILTKGSFEYNNVDEAKDSNLIQQLFYLPFVKKVFVSANFIAIERYKIVEWAEVETELNTMLSNFLTNNDSIFNTDTAKTKKFTLQIYTESTPNPNVNKFVCNKTLSKQIINVTKNDDFLEIPFAKALFNHFTTVSEIFIIDNYISVSKNNDVEWFEISNDIRTFIKQYLDANKKLVTKNFQPKTIVGFKTDKNEENLNLDSVSKEIIAVLDEYIKPAVTADGGNIMFQSYNKETKICEVVLQGACSGCPSSTITLKNGIEATLKQVLPNKISEVVAING